MPENPARKTVPHEQPKPLDVRSLLEPEEGAILQLRLEPFQFSALDDLVKKQSPEIVLLALQQELDRLKQEQETKPYKPPRTEKAAISPSEAYTLLLREAIYHIQKKTGSPIPTTGQSAPTVSGIRPKRGESPKMEPGGLMPLVPNPSQEKANSKAIIEFMQDFEKIVIGHSQYGSFWYRNPLLKEFYQLFSSEEGRREALFFVAPYLYPKPKNRKNRPTEEVLQEIGPERFFEAFVAAYFPEKPTAEDLTG